MMKYNGMVALETGETGRNGTMQDDAGISGTRWNGTGQPAELGQDGLARLGAKYLSTRPKSEIIGSVRRLDGTEQYEHCREQT